MLHEACILLLIVSNVAVQILAIDMNNSAFLKCAELLK